MKTSAFSHIGQLGWVGHRKGIIAVRSVKDQVSYTANLYGRWHLRGIDDVIRVEILEIAPPPSGLFVIDRVGRSPDIRRSEMGQVLIGIAYPMNHFHLTFPPYRLKRVHVSGNTKIGIEHDQVTLCMPDGWAKTGVVVIIEHRNDRIQTIVASFQPYDHQDTIAVALRQCYRKWRRAVSTDVGIGKQHASTARHSQCLQERSPIPHLVLLIVNLGFYAFGGGLWKFMVVTHSRLCYLSWNSGMVAMCLSSKRHWKGASDQLRFQIPSS